MVNRAKKSRLAAGFLLKNAWRCSTDLSLSTGVNMKFKSLLLNMARRFGYRPIADTPLLGEKIDYVEAKSTGEMGQILWEIHHGNHEKACFN
jgi:hypothetical protein